MTVRDVYDVDQVVVGGGVIVTVGVAWDSVVAGDDTVAGDLSHPLATQITSDKDTSMLSATHLVLKLFIFTLLLDRILLVATVGRRFFQQALQFLDGIKFWIGSTYFG